MRVLRHSSCLKSWRQLKHHVREVHIGGSCVLLINVLMNPRGHEEVREVLKQDSTTTVLLINILMKPRGHKEVREGLKQESTTATTTWLGSSIRH